jgi:hypothetical protein
MLGRRPEVNRTGKDAKIFTTEFFSGATFRSWGVYRLTGSSVGISPYREGACQLTKVGMGAGWVAHFADSSGGTPLSPAGPRRDRALLLLARDCGSRSGSHSPAGLTILCGRIRPTIVARCVRGNITQAIAINRFGRNFEGTLEFSE